MIQNGRILTCISTCRKQKRNEKLKNNTLAGEASSQFFLNLTLKISPNHKLSQLGACHSAQEDVMGENISTSANIKFLGLIQPWRLSGNLLSGMGFMYWSDGCRGKRNRFYQWSKTLYTSSSSSPLFTSSHLSNTPML